MNAHNSALESLDFTALVLPQDAQMIVTDTAKQTPLVQRESQSCPRDTVPAIDAIHTLLQRFQEQTRNWLVETPSEKQSRAHGLRRITYALFGLAVVLSSVLNGQFILQRASLPQLVICNFGITMVYLLAGVCLLHDITFRRRDSGPQTLDINRRLSVTLSQIEELLGVAHELGQRNEEIARRNLALNQQCSDSESEKEQAVSSLKEVQDCMQQSHIEKIELETQLRQLNKEIESATEQMRSVTSQHSASSLAAEARAKEMEAEIQALSVQLESNTALREEKQKDVLAIQNNLKLLQEEQSELQCCIASLHESVEARQKQLSEIDLSLSIAQEEFERIQLQSFDVSECLDAKRGDLENVLAEVTKANEQLRSLSQEADQHYECFKAASDTLECVRTENAELDTAVVIKRSMLQELEIQLEQLRLDFAETNTELDRIRQECAAASGYLSEQQHAVTESQRSVQRLSELEPQIADLDNKLAKRNAEIVEAENALLQLDIERAELLKRLEYSAALEAVASARIEGLNGDSDRFRSVRDELERSVELLQGQADAAESEVARLEAAKADAAKSLEGLLGSIEKLHSQELSLNQACASAEEKLSEWTNTADQLISQVEVLSGQIVSLERQKLDAVVAMEGLLQQIDDAKSERDQWIEKNNHQVTLVEEAEEKLASVKHQLQANETSLKDILNQLVSTELQYAKVAEGYLMEQAELQRLLECTRKAEADVDSVRAEKASLETRRSEILREIDGFEATRDDAMHAAESATERLQYLESKLQEASAELQAFAIERAQYQQEIVKHEQVKANMAAAQLRLDDLIAQGQLMERASKDARDEWNEVQQAIREAKFEMDTLAEKEKRFGEELDGLRIERDKLESECQRFDTQRKASEQEINDRKASLDRVNEEYAKAESRREKLLKSLDAISKEVDEAQSVCKQWDVYGDKLKSENEILAGELAQLRASLQSVEKERAALEQSKAALESSVNKLRKDAISATAEIEGKETKLTDLREEQARLLHLVGNAQSDLEDLQTHIQTSNLELVRLRSELDHAKNDVFDQRSHCDELANQCRELVEKKKSYANQFEAARLKLDEAERELGLRFHKISEVEQLIGERSEQANELLHQMDASKESLDLLECQYAATLENQKQQESELTAIKSEIQSQKKIMDGHCEQISQATVHMQRLLGEKDRIELVLGTLNDEMDQTKRALRDRGLELQAMESKRDAIGDEIQQRLESVAELERQLTSIQAAIAEEELRGRATSSQQQNAIDDLNRQIQTLSAEHDRATEQRMDLEQSISDRRAELEKLQIAISDFQKQCRELESSGAAQRDELENALLRLQDQHVAIQKQVQNAETALASKAEALLRLDVTIRDLDDQEQGLRVAVERLAKEQTVYDTRMIELRSDEESRRLDVLKLEELIAKRREEELVVSHQVDAIRLEIAELQARRESEAAASKKKLRIHKMVIRRDMAVGQLPLATSEIASIVPAPSVILQPKVGELIIEPNATTPAGDAEDVLLDEVMQSVEEVSQLVAMEDQLGDTEEQSFSAFTEEALVDDAWSFVLGNGS